MTRRPMQTLAAVILILSAPRALHSAPCLPAACSCPQISQGWILFEDSSRQVPDFWHDAFLDVLEITACRHGVSFIFLGREGKNLYLCALLFPDPKACACDVRQRMMLHSWRYGTGMERLENRYAHLRGALDRLSKGALRGEGRIDFRLLAPEARPRIVQPSWRLVLRWGGEEVELRGYLDVYLSLLV